MEAMACPSCGSPNITRINSSEYECQNCNTCSKLSNDSSHLIIVKYLCPDCGFDNEIGIKFCGNCGKKLMKYCVSCNTENLLDRKCCSNCGNTEFATNSGFSVVITPPLADNKLKKETIRYIMDNFHVGLKDAKNLSEKKSVIASLLPYDQAMILKLNFEKYGYNVEMISSNLAVDPILSGRFPEF